MPITSATYTGLGASSTHAAAAMAQTSHTPACQVPVAASGAGRVDARAAGRVCTVLVTSLGCFLDSGRAQLGCCVRSRG